VGGHVVGSCRQDAPDRLMIDSTLVKAHRSSGGGKGGLWRMVSAAPKAGGQPKSTS
jgi:hypothetical protein